MPLLLYINLLSLSSACPSWTRAVSFPVLRLRTSPSVACPPCHLLWPCGRERHRWSSWRKASRAWASVSWTTRSETCPSALPQIEQTEIDCSLIMSVSGYRMNAKRKSEKIEKHMENDNCYDILFSRLDWKQGQSLAKTQLEEVVVLQYTFHFILLSNLN